MPCSPLTRNLRDGQIVISDGAGTPSTLTALLTNGDLEWSEPRDTKEIKDRGILSHTRPGDQQTCPLSVSTMWTQLIGKSVSAATANVLYDLVNNLAGTYTSTGCTGEQFTLSWAFTVTDPAATRSELITFGKVYKTNLSCKEGDQTNTLSFSGTHFGAAPVVSRV